MRSFPCILLILCLAGPAIVPAGILTGADPSEDIPDRDTPRELKEAWLRFHSADLCQGMDAMFTFSKNGVEVRCLVEDEKSYQKLEELLSPLRGSFRVELYPAYPPPEEKKSDSEEDPPPSLWQNYELRSYLGDPLARSLRLNAETQPQIDMPAPGGMLKERLLIYAEQVLAWNRKMKRYAMDLPALVRVASDLPPTAELKLQADAVCMGHAQNLGKALGRLRANLSQAIPKPEKKGRPAPRSEKSGKAGKTPVDSAEQISIAAQDVAGRVHRFIYPEQYTVDLEELREPGLLETVKMLEGMVLDFKKELAKGR